MQYWSIYHLLTHHLVNDSNCLTYGIPRAELDVCIRWLMSYMTCTSTCCLCLSYKREKARFSDRWPAEVQAGHSNSDHRDDKGRGSLSVSPEWKGLSCILFWVIYACSLLCDVRGLVKTLRMKKMITPSAAWVIGHAFLQHAGGKYRGKFCIQYCMYLIPKKWSSMITLPLIWLLWGTFCKRSGLSTWWHSVDVLFQKRNGFQSFGLSKLRDALDWYCFVCLNSDKCTVIYSTKMRYLKQTSHPFSNYHESKRFSHNCKYSYWHMGSWHPYLQTTDYSIYIK